VLKVVSKRFALKVFELCLMAIYLQPNCIENAQDQDFSKLCNSYNYEQLAL